MIWLVCPEESCDGGELVTGELVTGERRSALRSARYPAAAIPTPAKLANKLSTPAVWFACSKLNVRRKPTSPQVTIPQPARTALFLALERRVMAASCHDTSCCD